MNEIKVISTFSIDLTPNLVKKLKKRYPKRNTQDAAEQFVVDCITGGKDPQKEVRKLK